MSIADFRAEALDARGGSAKRAHWRRCVDRCGHAACRCGAGASGDSAANEKLWRALGQGGSIGEQRIDELQMGTLRAGTKIAKARHCFRESKNKKLWRGWKQWKVNHRSR